MSYEPLHHKYRPQTFANLVGQEAIATTLTNAILTERIAPAYLFTGPRGTGKTSSARILAKSLNCQKQDKPTQSPCGVCEVCISIASGSALDVIEIDAASNTGVDNIREIIERAQFAPVQCRYKVYVIDECLTGDSLVQTSEGLIRIDDPSLKGKKVLSYNDSLRVWEFKKVLRWLDRGERQTLIIKTTNREIRCTGNHLIRTEAGWIAAKDLKEGAKILSPVNAAAAPSFTKLGRMDAPVDLLEVTSSKEIHKDFLSKKIKSLPIGSQHWAIQQKGSTAEETETKPTATSAWAQTQLESDWQTSDSTQSPQWTTSLETVESIKVAEAEKVYDIEVEDNHNFVANGLLLHNCHMLSVAAFNALLKTLEEPPARVVFVLATTDPQRVLPTIISRCQKFDFRRIPLEAMVKHLLHIASQENINITSDAITLVAQVAQGGLRDAESLLDQLSLLPAEVTVEAVWDLVGAVPEQDLMALTKAIADDNSEVVLDQCRRLMDRGREPLVVLQNLAGFYRDLLIAKTAPNRSNLVAVTPPTWKQLCEFAQQLDVSDILVGSQHLKNSEAQVKNTTQPRLWLEVTLLGLLPSANLSQPASTTSQPQRQKAEVKRQELQTQREPGRPQEVTPPVSSHSANQASPDSRQKPTPPPQEPTAPTSAPNRNPVSDPQHQQSAARAAKASPVSSSEPTAVQPAASTVPAAEQSSDSEQTIAQIWEQVLKNLHPFAAHALVSQHCHLLSFEGSVACVGVSSQPLLTLAQEKLPNLEAAFEAVYNYRVKVKLQIRHSKSSTTAPASRGSTSAEASQKPGGASSSFSLGNADTPNVPGSGNSRRDNSMTEAAERSEHRRVSAPSDTTENEPKSQSRVIDRTPQATVTQPAPKSSLTFAQRQVSPEPQPQTQVEIDRSSLTTVVDQSPISLSVQEVDSDADEVEQALRELKQFFEGEFVELTDEFSDQDSAIALAQEHDSVDAMVPQKLVDRSPATIASNTDQPQWSEVIDVDTYPLELEPEECWEEQDSIEKAASHQMQSREIAASENTQKPLRLENFQYDEDGDIAF